MGLGFSAPRTQESSRYLKTVPARSATAMSGQDLFREYCAVCHGAEARGDGPAADALKIRPTDLTRIARNNGGKFPEVRVENLISGEATGSMGQDSREMPVWGPIFRHMGPNPDLAGVRVYNLMRYIEELQAK